MRVLITGAAGQLGREVVMTCEQAGDVVTACDHAMLDVTDRDAVLGSVATARPDAVIHTAAWTAVDACESDPERAFRDNALAVRWVAEAGRRFGVHLVHLSTDYVFAGDRVGAYRESDEPAPRSEYGRSKRAGELEALTGAPGATVVRASWVCGEHGANMVKTVLRLAGEREELAFVDDQRGHPTFTADLAPMLRRLAVDRVPGLIHVTNQRAVSWFEFAREVMAAAGHDPERVRPIPTSALIPPRPAVRPANGALDNAVLRALGYPLLDDFAVPLKALVKRLIAR
ncbi:MAG: dTDP-4-dehydrorhamnose reductase [Acidimicrobiales bacterium]